MFAAVGGSILRDVLLNLPIALMHVSSLYAVAVSAGLSTIGGLLAFGVSVFLAATVGVVVIRGAGALDAARLLAAGTAPNRTLASRAAARAILCYALTSSGSRSGASSLIARLTADTTALSDAVEMSASMPTPHRVRPLTSSST